MDRRKFTVGSGMTAAAALAVSPARGQGGAQVRWRMASSFPRTLGMYQAAEIVAKRVEALTGGQFQIRVFSTRRDRARTAGSRRGRARHD